MQCAKMQSVTTERKVLLTKLARRRSTFCKRRWPASGVTGPIRRNEDRKAENIPLVLEPISGTRIVWGELYAVALPDQYLSAVPLPAFSHPAFAASAFPVNLEAPCCFFLTAP